MNPQDGNVLCPGHLNRAGCSSKDGAFYEEEQGAVIHQVPISLIERRPAAFGVPHHMNPVRCLAYDTAGNYPFVVAGKGQGNLQKERWVLFLLADDQFRRLGVHTNGISAEKVGGAQLYSLENGSVQLTQYVPVLRAFLLPGKSPGTSKTADHRVPSSQS